MELIKTNHFDILGELKNTLEYHEDLNLYSLVYIDKCKYFFDKDFCIKPKLTINTLNNQLIYPLKGYVDEIRIRYGFYISEYGIIKSIVKNKN